MVLGRLFTHAGHLTEFRRGTLDQVHRLRHLLCRVHVLLMIELHVGFVQQHFGLRDQLSLFGVECHGGSPVDAPSCDAADSRMLSSIA
jgi:hypothetical protein